MVIVSHLSDHAMDSMWRICDTCGAVHAPGEGGRLCSACDMDIWIGLSPVDRDGVESPDCQGDGVAHALPIPISRQLSWFPSLTDPHRTEIITMDRLATLIRSDDLKSQTDAIRSAYQSAGGGLQGKAATANLKKQLPGVTFAGVFSRRGNEHWTAPSGLVQIDIDGLNQEQLARIRAVLQRSPHITFLFTSPSGHGLKGAVLVGEMPCDAQSYTRSWRAVTAWLGSMGIENDPAAKDAGRLSFVCHDPDVYHAAQAVPLDITPWLKADVPTPATTVQPTVHEPTQDPAIIRRARQYLEQIPGAISGKGGHGQTYAATVAMVHGFGLSTKDALALLMDYNRRCDPPWSIRELQHKIDDAAKRPHEKPYGWLINEDTGPIPPGSPPSPGLTVLSAEELMDTYQSYRPVLIDGLLREGETMNVIAAPKVGKSWLVLQMAFNLANGGSFMGRTCAQCPVLIIDNELHRETVAQRFRCLRDQLQLSGRNVHLISLRGQLSDLESLKDRIEQACTKVSAKVIILDALYRLLPADCSENDNADMMHLYNTIDRIAKNTGAAVVCIHHSSKGNQGEKSITDGGSGAGSISRAADTHLFLREHEEAGLVVMEAVARSWPPPQPVVLTRDRYAWMVSADADPARIKGRRIKAGPTLKYEQFIEKYLPRQPEPVASIKQRIVQGGDSISKDSLQGMLTLAINRGHAVMELGKGNTKHYGSERDLTGTVTTMKARVLAYRVEHPEATQQQIATALGCDVRTVQRVG